MRFQRVLIWTVAFLAAIANVALASERPLEFLKALRGREYFDFANFYLDELEARPNLDQEIRDVLSYQRGLTVLGQAEKTRDSDAQSKLYDDARLHFEKFVKDHPQHELAGTTNSQIAEVVLGKAKSLIWQANSPNNSGRKEELRKQARALLAETKTVYQAAYDRYKVEYDKHDKFVDTNEKRNAREKAFTNLVQAEFHLAQLIHQEAATHDRLSATHIELLKSASKAFEAIHAKYRSQIIGIYGRMYQGKCFEEMDEITMAMGIYNELLEHKDKNGGTLDELQNVILQFRLVCLNHEKRKDYRVVIQEAEAWLKANRNRAVSRVGLGIQWELARAEEQLAKLESTAESERRGQLKSALEHARKINRYPGEYKDPSTSMIRRLLSDLDRGSGDPKDFSSAFSLARTQVDEIRTKVAEMAKVQGVEKQRLREELKPTLNETARVLQLALRLAGKKDPDAEVNRARYHLSYVYYLMQDHSYDAGVLAEWVGRKYVKEHSDMALDASYLAQAAYIQAYNREAKDKRSTEIAWVVDVCNHITKNWPSSDKAQDARMNLGGLYVELGQPAEAAKWYSAVPETSPQYLDAQLKAGNAWWDVYILEQTRPESERKPKEAIDEFLTQARSILAAAINKFEANLPKEVAQVEPSKLRDLSLAKVTLASILNGAGDYKGALGLLTDNALPAVAGIDTFTKGTKQHLNVAVATYIQVLRAHIGNNDLTKAQAAQQALDSTVKDSGSGGKALTQVYVEFGSQLKKEVQRLQSARDPRLGDVLKSFETFLDEIAKRKESQTYYSLRWIGETYRDLGEGVGAGDRLRSEGYFGKAATAFQQILDEDKKAPGFLPADSESGIQLAIVRCQRLKQDFEQAEKGILKILKSRPKALDAQEEAAQLYADWAKRGSKGDQSKWTLAIEGDTNLKSRKPENRVVWGWFGIAQRLENSLGQKSAGSEDLEEKYFNARFQTARVRFDWSLAEQDEAKRRQRMGLAYRDIRLTATVMPGLGGDEGYQRFNKLYREIQQQMINIGKFDEVAGKTSPVDLDRKQVVSGTVGKAKKAKTTSQTKDSPKKTAGTDQKSQANSADSSSTNTANSDSGSFAPVFAGLLLLIGAAAVIFFVVKSGRRSRRPVVDTAPITGPRTATEPKKKPAQQTRPKATASGVSPPPPAEPQSPKPKRPNPLPGFPGGPMPPPPASDS